MEASNERSSLTAFRNTSLHIGQIPNNDRSYLLLVIYMLDMMLWMRDPIRVVDNMLVELDITISV